jgi:hypothetical protein
MRPLTTLTAVTLAPILFVLRHLTMKPRGLLDAE